MERFDIPVSGGRVNDSNSKELVISSYQGNLVRAPYEGVVEKMDPNHCGGYVKIQHTVNGHQCYSSFCEVNRITVNKGDNVRKGNSIGIMGDKDITYSILDNGGKKINTKPFFNGIDNSSKDDKTSKSKKEPKPSNKDTSSSSHNLGVPKDDNGQDIFTAAGLAPFNLLDKLLNIKPIPLNKESVIKDKVLQEELKRIKRLL
jgi:murein DD-endopeptidase MepM/ murein hydrolase activator NlpD